MKPMRKNVVQFIVAMGITLSSAAVFGEPVITPYSPDDTAPVLMPAEEAAFQGNMGAGIGEGASAGGTMAPELGGVVGSDSLDRLPEVPGPVYENETGQPE